MGLKKTREKLGITQNDMARLMGISRLHNYQRLESGRRDLTAQQKQAIRTVEFVNYHGLLETLLREFDSPAVNYKLS